MKTVDSYTSCMHVHVRYYVYRPKVVIRMKGVVQIQHGLGEHADRYDHFASFLSQQGFVVVVSDIVGHGKSLIDFEQGFFGHSDGIKHLIDDMFHLQEIIRPSYPDIPYFMLGVDFGSLLIRKYMSEYGDFVDGVLLLGTPTHIKHKYLKNMYLSLMKSIKGSQYKGERYFKHLLTQFNRSIYQGDNTIDYLTTDPKEKQIYLSDPMTHFPYTIQGYRDINALISEVNSEDSINQIPPYLSIYIGIGQHDPLSLKIQLLMDKYKKRGIKDLTLKVFDERRHALLFERNKKEIYLDILEWLNERTYL